MKSTADPRVEFTRVIRNGTSFCIILPRGLVASVGLHLGDRLAARQHGDMIVLERVAMEKLAQIIHQKPPEVTT